MPATLAMAAAECVVPPTPTRTVESFPTDLNAKRSSPSMSHRLECTGTPSHCFRSLLLMAMRSPARSPCSAFQAWRSAV